MPDREKVIKGLECHFLVEMNVCEKCPYYPKRNCSDDMAKDALALLKAQEPRLVIEADFEKADEYGFIPTWYEGLVNKESWWNCITKEELETAKEDGCRYWTSKPSLKQMEETPWN